jgi:hypothetical protein
MSDFGEGAVCHILASCRIPTVLASFAGIWQFWQVSPESGSSSQILVSFARIWFGRIQAKVAEIWSLESGDGGRTLPNSSGQC